MQVLFLFNTREILLIYSPLMYNTLKREKRTVDVTYKSIVKGTFLSRPNRFIARVMIEGKEETVHVKNTGRCREILVPGADVYLEKASNPDRRTKYDLIAVRKETADGTLLINIDSQIPNYCAEEFFTATVFFGEGTEIKREVKYGNSRFDLQAVNSDMTAFIEVKGVTLERDGRVLFPDAPTERGVKHIRELIKAKSEGYGAYIFFVVQMTGVKEFAPNEEMHPEFAAALREAELNGVKILAYDCTVTPDSIVIKSPLVVNLSKTY